MMSRLLVAGSLVCALLAARTLEAQEFGRVRGVLFDSLSSKPLVGATLLVSGSDRIGVTDLDGRFDLDSIPVGRRTLTFSSPALDSLGLFTLGRDVVVVAGQTVTVAMGTPSYSTMWQSLCPRTPRLRGDSGIVYGSIINAADELRLQGAVVIVTWWALGAEGTKITMDRPMTTARSDSTGNYYVCGVPTDMQLTVEIAAGEFAAGNAEISLGAARVSRRDFLVSSELRAVPAPPPARASSRMGAPVLPAAARPRGTSTLRGLVRDARGNPVQGALVTMTSADTSARTNAEGRFTLAGLPAGTQLVRVLRLGNGPLTSQVDLRPNQVLETVFDLPAATVLAAMNVNADRRTSAQQLGFEERRKSGFGRYIGPELLAGRPDFSSVLRNVPTLQVQRRGLQTSVTITRGPNVCTPAYFLDGRRSSLDELNFFVPDELFGVEVYTSGGTIPTEFLSNNNCGAVVVWTKRGRL